MIELLQIREVTGALLGVGGILVGILLRGLFQRSKERSAVRARAIETIQVFFSYRKAYVEAVNTKSLDIRKYGLLNQSMRNPSDGDRKDDARLGLLSSVIQQEVERCNMYYEKVCETEAKIHVCLMDIHRLFGQHKYQKAVNLIKPEIHFSNSSTYLKDWNNISPAEVNETARILDKIIANECDDLQDRCDGLVAKVYKLL